LTDLETEATEPSFWDDQDRARKAIDETNALRVVLQPYDAIVKRLDDVNVLIELAEEEGEEAGGAAALEEAASDLDRIESDAERLEVQSLLSGALDAKNAYLSINAGAGGTESCDWADMLYRMYKRYCERHDFDVMVLDFQPGDEAGIKSVEFQVAGPFAYGYLKAERGVHRLVRISPFDANSRRHTSFVALDVIAEVDEEVDVEIREEDLRVDTYRSSGAGGQHVNTTDSAVRITHLPTGLVVQCQAERSQHKNRSKAMQMLKAKLYEWEQDQKRKELEKFYGKKGEIAWGSQIRSYVLQPYTLAKDHRTNHEAGNVQGVLDGELDGFIQAYLKKQRADEHP
jgi:peptide chain release factor 2